MHAAAIFSRRTNMTDVSISKIIRPVRRSLLKRKPELIWPPLEPGEELTIVEAPPVAPAIYRGPGHVWAHFRGTEDAHRFWERAQAQAPLTLETVINNRHFQIDDLEQGIRFKATGTTQWEYVFGRTPKRKRGDGSGGKDGSQDGDGQIPFEILIDPKKLEEFLFKGLELPHMEGKKAAAETELAGMKLVGLGRHGTHADFERYESLKHYILSIASFLLEHPEMMPPEDSELLVPVDMIPPDKARDFWYWQFDEERRPISQAAVYLLTDISGSMTQEMRTLAYKIAYLVIRFLQGRYEKLKIIILGHTSGDPIEYPNWQAMVDDKQTGGTVISKSLQWIRKHAWANNPPNAWNCYGCQAGDGDNYGSDNALCLKALKALFDDGFNFWFFWETLDQMPWNGRWSAYADALRQLDKKYFDMVYIGRIINDKTLVEEFRKAFTKRTARQKT
jgi:uncharacterized sporulation protein YeaH/YhbH (DUF444 family)